MLFIQVQVHFPQTPSSLRSENVGSNFNSTNKKVFLFNNLTVVAAFFMFDGKKRRRKKNLKLVQLFALLLLFHVVYRDDPVKHIKVLLNCQLGFGLFYANVFVNHRKQPNAKCV